MIVILQMMLARLDAQSFPNHTTLRNTVLLKAVCDPNIKSIHAKIHGNLHQIFNPSISSSTLRIPIAQYTLVPGFTCTNLRSLLSFGGPLYSSSRLLPATRSSLAFLFIVRTYGGPLPNSAARFHARSQPEAIRALVCHPVKRATSRNLVMVHPL